MKLEFADNPCFSGVFKCNIDNTDVLGYVQDMKKLEILKEHQDSIWYSEKEGYWYCCLPDETKPKGWKNVKRKKQEAIEKVLCDYYLDIEEQERRKQEASLEELFYEFMEHKKKMVKAGTVKRMVADWDRFYKPHPEFIKKKYKEITKIDVDDFLNDVVNKNQLKAKAFHNMCGVLKQTFNYAVDAEYIEKSPYRVKVSKKKVLPNRKNCNTKEVFSKEEQGAIIREMERRIMNNPSNTAPLAVMLDFELGARKGEILGLRVSDIENGKIHISRQVVEKFDETDTDNIKSLGFEVVEYTKSECGDRWLPLTKRAMQLIHRIQMVNEWNDNVYKDFLFVRNGTVMSPDAVDTQLIRGCNYIGIPVKTMHKIRKTYASTLYENGVSIPVIADMLGHADENTTLKHYIFTRINNEEKDQLVLSALQPPQDIVAPSPKNVRRRETKIVSFRQ